MTAPGLVAEFASAEALAGAVEEAKRAGYSRLDAFSPYPLPAVAQALGVRTRAIPVAGAAAGLIGGAVQYYAQYWMNVVDYPIDVGGRPLHSWPAFVPGPLVVTVLWAAVSILLTFLFLTGLPRLHHPVFDAPGFERASDDRFFLWIEGADPRFEPEATRRFLQALGPLAVRDLGA